jgi:zeaxanthin glucosyltransferase
MHFGIITPPVPGHLHPFGALGRELIERGHRVTLFQMEDVRTQARAEGLEFFAIGGSDHPEGSLARSLAELGNLKGMSALRFTIRAVAKTTEMVCRDAPEAIRAAGVDVLLVDQTEPAGGSVADHLRIPYITICNALTLNREPAVPPPFTDWSWRESRIAHLRNRLGYRISDLATRPINRVLARYRQQWRLPRHEVPEDSFSRLGQISQQPPAFDFPRRELPRIFHYVGPLRKPSARKVEFPWERLDGRPLVYASLGTLQHSKQQVFRCFAEACEGLDVQLVIAHNGGLDETAVRALPGQPVAVSYAPQREVLAKASLALTHAGLNTVLDALTYGVPVVAVPVTYEQPAIAARVEWSGAGRALSLPRLSSDRLAGLIRDVLIQPSFKQRAAAVASSIREAGGVAKAANLIEELI